MGEPKQLLTVRGRPLLELIVSAANRSRLDDVVVVLGAGADAVRERVDLGRAQVVVNPDHARGMSSSLQAGVRALAAGVDRAVVILGDQPDVDAATIDALLDAQETSQLPAAALRIGEILHPPVVLRRELWPGLMALDGDIGCRRLIRAHPELVAAIEVPGPDDHPVDIDTPEDYRRLLGDAGAS